MKFFENEELSFFNSRKTIIFHSEMEILTRGSQEPV
jgi:hypothetical protein